VAGIDRQDVVAQPGDGAIEKAPHGVTEKRFGPRSAHAVDDFITRLPMPDEVEDEIRRVLQIAIDLDCGIATGETIAGEDRALKPEIPRETINPHPGIAGSEPIEALEGAIRAAIVGEDEFPAIPLGDPLERPIDGVVERLDVGFLVVDRHDDGKKLHDWPHPHGAPARAVRFEARNDRYLVDPME